MSTEAGPLILPNAASIRPCNRPIGILDELLTAFDRSDGDEVRRLAAEAGTAFLDIYLFFADQLAGS